MIVRRRPTNIRVQMHLRSASGRVFTHRRPPRHFPPHPACACARYCSRRPSPCSRSRTLHRPLQSIGWRPGLTGRPRIPHLRCPNCWVIHPQGRPTAGEPPLALARCPNSWVIHPGETALGRWACQIQHGRQNNTNYNAENCSDADRSRTCCASCSSCAGQPSSVAARMAALMIATTKFAMSGSDMAPVRLIDMTLCLCSVD